MGSWKLAMVAQIVGPLLFNGSTTSDLEIMGSSLGGFYMHYELVLFICITLWNKNNPGLGCTGLHCTKQFYGDQYTKLITEN